MISSKLRYTTSDLELLPKRDDLRYEIINGELLVSTAPHLGHQITCTRVSTALDLWSQQAGLGVTAGGPGIIFTQSDNVIPDIVWISHRRLSRQLDKGGHIHIAPELVVEVLSEGPENERRDLDLKLKLYSVEGVREYWIVNWRSRVIRVYRHEGMELRLVGTLGDGDTLTSPILPGFELGVSSLWPPALEADHEPAND